MDIYVSWGQMADNLVELKRLASKVFETFGPGHHEYVYDRALQIAMASAGVPFESQPVIPLFYHNQQVSYVQPDFVVGGSIVLELKSQITVQETNTAQANKYMRVLNAPIVCLLNFPLLGGSVDLREMWNYAHPFWKNKEALTADILNPFAQYVTRYRGSRLNPNGYLIEPVPSGAEKESQ